MTQYLPSSRDERKARRARILERGEVVDPAMLRVALAEADGLAVGKRSAKRPGRRGYAYRRVVP